MTQTAEMTALLARVRQRFDAMLAGRLSTLDSAMDRAEGATARRDALIEARSVLHQIAGSAGSLGLPTLGDEARVCEQAIDTFLSRGTPPWPVLRDGIRAFSTAASEAA